MVANALAPKHQVINVVYSMYDIYISEWISYSNLSWLDQSLNFTSIIWSISIPMTSCKWASHPTKLFHYSIISSFFPKKIHLFCINPLLPSYTIRRHRSWSRLTRVIACCLKAPSHKRNQCWQFCGIPCSSIFLRMHEMVTDENKLQYNGLLWTILYKPQ